MEVEFGYPVCTSSFVAVLHTIGFSLDIQLSPCRLLLGISVPASRGWMYSVVVKRCSRRARMVVAPGIDVFNHLAGIVSELPIVFVVGCLRH